jgi:hypothetical protein
LFNFSDTSALNDRFDFGGYGSKNVIQNLGSGWIFMVLLPIQFAIIRLIIYLAAKHPIFDWLKQRVHDEEDMTATFSNAA